MPDDPTEPLIVWFYCVDSQIIFKLFRHAEKSNHSPISNKLFTNIISALSAKTKNY